MGRARGLISDAEVSPECHGALLRTFPQGDAERRLGAPEDRGGCDMRGAQANRAGRPSWLAVRRGPGGRQQSDHLLPGAAGGMATARPAKTARNKTMKPP